MSRTPRFKGYDFTELITAWGLPMSENGLDSEEDIKTIKEHILSKWSWDKGEQDPETKKDMVKFIDALLKTKLSGYEPVYRAMKRLDDFEFINVFNAMLPHMWT